MCRHWMFVTIRLDQCRGQLFCGNISYAKVERCTNCWTTTVWSNCLQVCFCRLVGLDWLSVCVCIVCLCQAGPPSNGRIVRDYLPHLYATCATLSRYGYDWMLHNKSTSWSFNIFPHNQLNLFNDITLTVTTVNHLSK